MTIARSVADVLRNHVVLEYEPIDRMYLNVYVPHLQTVGAMVGYLRVHHGQRFASTTAVAPMTEAFVRNVEEFVVAEGVDLITFEKKQRKDDVTQKFLRDFKRNEGVPYVGEGAGTAYTFVPTTSFPATSVPSLRPCRRLSLSSVNPADRVLAHAGFGSSGDGARFLRGGNP